MKYKKTLNVQAKIDQMPGKLKRIDEAKVLVSTEKMRVEKRLDKLKEKYPRMLARRALKQSTDGEILAIKRKIVEMEELLADFPLTLQGLDELERSIHNEIVKDQNGVGPILATAPENA